MRLFISNIDYSAGEADLREFFVANDYQPGEVKLIRDRSDGRSRGYAFVELPGEDVATVMRHLDGQELLGRRLNVRQAEPRPENQRRGRHNGRDRHGRDGGRHRER